MNTNECENILSDFNTNHTNKNLKVFFDGFSQRFQDLLKGLLINLGDAIEGAINKNANVLNQNYGNKIEVSNSSKNVAKKITNNKSLLRISIIRAIVKRLCSTIKVNAGIQVVMNTNNKNKNNLNKAIEELLKYIKKYDEELERRISDTIKPRFNLNANAIATLKGRKINTNSITNASKLIAMLNSVKTGNKSNINILKGFLNKFSKNKGAEIDIQAVTNFNSFLKMINSIRSQGIVNVVNNEARQLLIKSYRKKIENMDKEKLNLNVTQKAEFNNFKRKTNKNITQNSLNKLVQFHQDVRGRPRIYLLVNVMKTGNTLPNYISNHRPPTLKYEIITGNSVKNAQNYSTRYISKIMNSENDDRPKNIFFTGPSGSGKTTLFESYLKSRKNNYDDNSCVHVFLPTFCYKPSEGTITISDRCEKMKLSQFRMKYIRETIFNKQGSRAHMFVKIGNDCLFDLAGTENPIKILVDTLKFNIFKPEYWRFESKTYDDIINLPIGRKFEQIFDTMIRNSLNEIHDKEMRNFKISLGLDPKIISIKNEKLRSLITKKKKEQENEKEHLISSEKDSLYRLIFVLIYYNFYRNGAKGGEGSGNYVKSIGNLRAKQTTENLKGLSKLYNGIRRCFEGFYIMRSLHSLKTIFSNYKNYDNMVSKNINTANEKNRILINSINTNKDFTLKIRDIQKNEIVPTQTMLDLCTSYEKEGLFTIKNKNASKNGKYPTEFIKFLLNRRDKEKARNIMFGVVQGNLNKINPEKENERKTIETKKAQVKKAIEYFNFLQS
jgi:hypothetical protein